MPAEHHRANGPPGDLRRTAWTLTGLRLDELLHEVQDRIGEIVRTRDRLQGLLDAVLAVASGLEIESTLRRIVGAALDLVDAEYGALGVLDEDGRLVRFVDSGLPADAPAHAVALRAGLGAGDVVTDSRPARWAALPARPVVGTGTPGAGSGQQPVPGFLAVPVRVRGAVFGNLYLAEKRGEAKFTGDDEAVLQALAAAAGVAVDNARLFERSRTRERWLSAVAEINGELLAGASVDETLTLIVRRVCELTEGEDAFILLASDEGTEAVTVSVATGGRAPELAALSVDTRGDTPIAEVMREGRPRLVADLTTALPDGSALPSSGFGPGAIVPLTGTSGSGGVLLVVKEKGEPGFTAEELPVLTSLADQTAVALEFADKQRGQRVLDLLAERDRIAQELNDHVIQRLFATGMNLQGTLRRIGDPRARSRVEQVVEQLDDTVREIRTSIFDLHTSGGRDEGSVRRRLLDIVEELTADTAVTPTLRMSGAVDTCVPAWVGEHAGAVLREALSNAVRHSGGDRLRVVVEAGEQGLLVEVADNGVGLPPDAPRSGLNNMRNRARECGGELVLSDEPGGGTCVRWHVPLSEF